MKRIIIYTACVVLILSCFSIYCFSESNNVPASFEESNISIPALDEDFVPGEVIVIIKKEYSAPNKEWSAVNFSELELISVEDLFMIENEEALEWINIDQFQQILKLTLKTQSKEAVIDAIQKLNVCEFIQSAGINASYTVDIPEELTDPQEIATRSSTSVSYPNDCSYNLDEFNQISLPEAWNIHTDGYGALIGVMDSGIDCTHPDLSGRIMQGYGRNFTDDNLGPHDDETGHGTHVAGIIGAIGNNNSMMAGVCWNGIPMASLKILKKTVDENGNTKSTGKPAWVIEALEYATNKGIKLLNMSFGSKTLSSTSIQELQTAINNYPGLIICAAGNLAENETESDRDNDINKPMPSSLNNSNIITVAAIDDNDNLSSYSYYGATTVDLAAPGDAIYSTLPGGICGYKDGTSMAAPYVTGVAALIMSFTDWSLTPVQVKNYILNGTTPLDSLTGKCVTGGKLNAYLAIRNAIDNGKNPVVAGDFDGDGVDELAGFYGRNNYTALIYWENLGNKFDIQAGTVACTIADFPIARFEGQVAGGDFDGDGLDEIGVLCDHDTYLSFWIFDYQTDGSFTKRLVGNTGNMGNECVRYRVTAGNIDNDAKDEMLALYDYGEVMGYWCFEINNAGIWSYDIFGRSGAMDHVAVNNRVSAGDFDGDGKDELGVLYDNPANTTGLFVFDGAYQNFTYRLYGQLDGITHGYSKGLVSAGDFNGDGIDEMMSLYPYDLYTSHAGMRMYTWGRDTTGTFRVQNSDQKAMFYTPSIAYTMVTGRFSTSASRDAMAGIYDYGTYSKVFAFERPNNSTWTCTKLA